MKTVPRSTKENVLTFRGIDAASVLFGLGKYPKALQYVNRVLAREPEHFEALLLRATILGSLGHQRSALSLINQLLERRPTSYEVKGRKAEVLVETGRYLEAAQIFSEVVRSKSLPHEERAYYYSQLINALMGGNRRHEARRIVKRALRTFPDDEVLQLFRKELTKEKHG